MAVVAAAAARTTTPTIIFFSQWFRSDVTDAADPRKGSPHPNKQGIWIVCMHAFCRQTSKGAATTTTCSPIPRQLVKTAALVSFLT